MRGFTNIFPSCFIAFVRLSKTTLNFNGDSRNLCMISELNWLSFNILPFGVFF